MAFTHTLGLSYSTNAGTIVNVSETATGTYQGVDIDTQVGIEQTVNVPVMITVAMMQSILFSSDQPVTLKTNNAATPQDTINLRANIPVAWTVNSYWPAPFKGDVTALIVTNEGPAAANIKIRVLSN
jgi:hypothetical protein